MTDASSPHDRFSHLTDAQRRAVKTVDRSILVSAAAGSGKTTVLAERCAALVCDLDADRRCAIDELLVVTFTDAAAGEMRSRIRNAIRDRKKDRPRDAYLERQLHLLDQASISTIHAFCKKLIQRWFPQAGIDPQATVLAGNEAELLRREVLDELFVELYAGREALGLDFQAMVDDYGGGNDYTIGETLLRIHSFISSLPEPEHWLSNALQQSDPDQPGSLIDRLDELQRERLCHELKMQVEYTRACAATIRRCWPIASIHIDWLNELESRLSGWLTQLQSGPADLWKATIIEIRNVALPSPRRSSRLSDEEKAAYDHAKVLRDDAKTRFKKRLQDALCRFSAEEYREGLVRVFPYIRTLIELVKQLNVRYQEAKASQGAIDFNDLQRNAYLLLTDHGDADRASEIAVQLQQQYRHVLVDEFQDVDPLQEAILRLVSREHGVPPEGNLFAVGDVKQSIYRFRLAEPNLFSQRADAFADNRHSGELIHLQDNFRSRSSIIDAVNVIFESLMSRSFGGSDYDESARLYAGARYPQSGETANIRVFDKPAIEMHLLEPITEQTRSSDDDDGSQNEQGNNGQDSAADELLGIEREAWLIGDRIRHWMGHSAEGVRYHVTDKPATPGGPPTTRPIEFRDMVILLRSLPHKAEPIADVLRRMGIPTQVGRDDSSIDSTEFRDVISLLSLLDNRRQDIPLTAILRSPLLGDPLDETDLLTARLHHREVPFHQAILEYAESGDDPTLRERLAILLAKIERYHRLIQQRPVADVLWEIYEDNHYLAYVAGLPDGIRRREHLTLLHDLARQFGDFKRQGLRRFLRFIEEMLKREHAPQPATSASADDNVVRIMTVHTSKGLEFPVVILADLSKRFNLSDTTATMLVDRDIGIGMRAAEAERRVLYPTLTHQLASSHSRREDLSEELRVLYVALTRAREHLVLMGRQSLNRIATWRAMANSSSTESHLLPRLELEAATCPLDWLIPAICSAPADQVYWHGDAFEEASPLMTVSVYNRNTTNQWQLPPAVREERTEVLRQLATLAPLPPDESIDRNVDGLIKLMVTPYTGLELTTTPARVTVTELKRRWESSFEPGERLPRETAGKPSPACQPAFVGHLTRETAIMRGTATHRFLQRIDLNRPCDASDLRIQLEALVRAGILSADESASVLLESCGRFFSTEIGQMVLQHADLVRREIPFVSRIDPSQYDPQLGAADSRDVLLLRGTVDLLVCHGNGLDLLDYKTDMVRAEACERRAESYRSQMDHYAVAMGTIYKRPVRHRWLVFLQANQIIDMGHA